MDHVLAQVNIGRLRAPLDSDELAGFVAALEPVNAAADHAPGFVWRLQTEDGDATAIQGFQWDVGDSIGVLVNMSVWESIEALASYVYSDTHRSVLRRRREWFQKMTEAHLALWWIPQDTVPTVADAESRLLHLRVHGSTAHAFTLRSPFPAPGSSLTTNPSPDWLCPA